MNPNGIKTKRVPNIFAPSGGSLVTSIFVMGTVIFLHQISSIQQYLEVPKSFNIFRIIASWLDKTLTSLIGQSKTEVLVVGLFWALVGLGVYLFLRGVSRFFTELSEGLDERDYLWPKGVDRNR